MKKSLKIFAVSAGLTIYEILLTVFAGEYFSLNRDWFIIVNSMPVTQSNVEFVIFLGQIPILIFIGWLWHKKRKSAEIDLLEKYSKANDDKKT